MGGIVMGALAGAGGQLADSADKQITQDQTLERERYSSDLATQRAEALELFKENRTNVQRTQMVQRVGAAADQIADEQLAPKVGQEQAGIVDRAAWTPEQQAAVDQSNAIDKKGIVNRAMNDGSAGLRSGDISPKDAMGNSSKLEINQLKMDNLLQRADDKNQTAKQIADVRAEAMRYGYELRLQAAQERQANGKIDRATGRMLITSEDANIKASTNQMQMLGRELENAPSRKDGKPNPRIDEINAQIQTLRDDIDESKAKKDGYLQDLGILPKKDAAPAASAGSAPAAAAPAQATPSVLPAGVPAGSKQIGLSGGKPVYQSPDGKKWKVQ